MDREDSVRPVSFFENSKISDLRRNSGAEVWGIGRARIGGVVRMKTGRVRWRDCRFSRADPSPPDGALFCPSQMTILPRRMMSRKVWETLVRSSTSTLQGRSEALNASRRVPGVRKSRGSSPMTTRSRSDVSFAVLSTRDPKATPPGRESPHPGFSGQCSDGQDACRAAFLRETRRSLAAGRKRVASAKTAWAVFSS